MKIDKIINKREMIYMINDELIKTLTYKEFKVFCNQRACDGRWSILEAMAYLDVIDEIDKIKVKFLGLIPLKKKTELAREKAWQDKLHNK